MKELNNDAIIILTTMFNKRKFMNVGELTATYNQKEIKVLRDNGIQMVHLIDLGASQGILAENFGSIPNAIMFKSFIESQTIFLNRALLYNEGALVFGFKTLENSINEGILYQN